MNGQPARALLEERRRGFAGMTTTTTIDAEGQAWDGFAPPPGYRLRPPLAASELSDLVVKDMGFVVLRRYGSRSVELRHRPGRVKPMALLTAVQWLTDNNCDKIALTAWVGTWETSVVGDLAATVEHLMALAEAAQSTRQRDFQTRRHTIGVAAADASAGILDAWRAARGAKDQRLMEAIANASCGRYLEVVPQHGASRLIVDGIGNGYALYGGGWRSLAIGGRFEDMPDYEYAQWAARGYRDVFRAGEPIVEDITAAIRLPRSGRLRLTYRRVILPIGGGEHPLRLLGATLSQRVMHLEPDAASILGDVVQ